MTNKILIKLITLLIKLEQILQLLMVIAKF